MLPRPGSSEVTLCGFRVVKQPPVTTSLTTQR